MEYKIVIYGDLNGDGKINSIDLLGITKAYIRNRTITRTILLAGNINKNGKNPSSIDSLLIQETYFRTKVN